MDRIEIGSKEISYSKVNDENEKNHINYKENKASKDGKDDKHVKDDKETNIQQSDDRMSKKYRLLMLTTLIISGCSMCYELIISAVSSYLLGNSTLQYSITIGLYMAALGLGSYVSKYFKKRLFNVFVMIELCIGIVGGMSAILLFLANIYIENYDIVM